MKPCDMVLVVSPRSKNHLLIGEVVDIPKTKKGRLWVRNGNLHHEGCYLPSNLQLYMKAVSVLDDESPTGETIIYEPILNMRGVNGNEAI